MKCMYENIETLGELLKHKDEYLLFGYWDKDFPSFAWAVKLINAVSSADDENDPATTIDGITVRTESKKFIVLYDNCCHITHNGKTYKNIHTRICDEEEYFDGQLFCRTLTPAEQQIFDQMKESSDDSIRIDKYIDEDDNIIEDLPFFYYL